MMVRIAVVVVLLLGLVAVARPAPAQASWGPCLIDHYIELWFLPKAIFQAYLVNEFPVDDITRGFHVDVTRVWKGNPPKVVKVITEERLRDLSRMSSFPRYLYLLPQSVSSPDGLEADKIEHFFYYGGDGYVMKYNEGYCSPVSFAKDFAGSEPAAARIMYYSERVVTVVMAAVLALILRAAWRRRAGW